MPFTRLLFSLSSVSILVGITVSPCLSALVFSLQTVLFSFQKSVIAKEACYPCAVTLLSLLLFKIQHIPRSASLAVSDSLFVDALKC